MELKYIVYTKDDIERFVIFDKITTHLDVASGLHMYKPTILGAGFITIRDTGWYCYGRSETLNISSRDELDAEVITLCGKAN